MEEKHFKTDAKTVVDGLFNARLFNENVTRDDMNAAEELIAFCMQSRYEGYLRMKDLSNRIESNKSEEEKKTIRIAVLCKTIDEFKLYESHDRHANIVYYWVGEEHHCVSNEFDSYIVHPSIKDHKNFKSILNCVHQSIKGR